MIQSNPQMVLPNTLIFFLQIALGLPITQGPMLGDLTDSSVKMWVRSSEPTQVIVVLQNSCLTFEATTTEDTDLTAIIQLSGLEPSTMYNYFINGEHRDSWWFKTSPKDDPHVKIAFGSCANEKEGSSKVWNRMNADNIDALVLLGDTPYIDTTDLAIQRKRYREFAEVPAFADLVSHTPVYSIWDDHDFGRNDTDGNLVGKEKSRQAFSEYRPNPSLGEEGQGIYTKFRKGPVEVFLLDARWFARTEKSENKINTLLGKQQWAWLERSLKASTAPFKILACGMIFNDATRLGKTDYWGNYPTEYYRLLSVIKRNSISGISLVSGDIHWSRVIKHDTKSKIGYDLIEFITSPIHEKLISAANAPHEGDLFSIGEINSFLLLNATRNAEARTLTMTITNASGEALHVQTISHQE